MLQDMDLQPSKSKMTVTCSSMVVANKVCRTVGRLGYRAVSALEVLGVEVASGRPLRFGKLKARIGKMKLRHRRFRKLRRAGPLLGRFVKQAVPSALAYGVGVHGAVLLLL